MTAELDTYRLTPCPKRPSEQRVTRAAELQFQLQFTAVQEVHAGPAKGVGPGWTALNGHEFADATYGFRFNAMRPIDQGPPLPGHHALAARRGDRASWAAPCRPLQP